MNLRFNKFKKKNLIYVAVFSCILLILASLVPTLRNPVLNTLKYPLKILTLTKGEILGLVFYHRNFMENERLKKEIDLLKRKLNEVDEIYLENARLKNLLSYKQKSPYKVVVAKVIGRSPDTWSSVIIVDKGERQGIKQGMIAINYLGLAGKVIETQDGTSQVMLLNDLNFCVSGIVQRSRQEGLVCATLGESLVMRYLSQDADIQISDIIVTSGLTPAFPKGLLIGTVVGLDKDSSGLESFAIIKPLVNLSNIEEILIIVSS